MPHAASRHRRPAPRPAASCPPAPAPCTWFTLFTPRHQLGCGFSRYDAGVACAGFRQPVGWIDSPGSSSRETGQQRTVSGGGLRGEQELGRASLRGCSSFRHLQPDAQYFFGLLTVLLLTPQRCFPSDADKEGGEGGTGLELCLPAVSARGSAWYVQEPIRTPRGPGSPAASRLAGGEGSGLSCSSHPDILGKKLLPRKEHPRKAEPRVSPCRARGARLRIPAFRNRLPDGEHRENFACRKSTTLLFPAESSASPGLLAWQAGHAPRLERSGLTETGKAISHPLSPFFSRFPWLSEMWGPEVFPDSSATPSF